MSSVPENQYQSVAANSHPSFSWVKSQYIDSLQLEVQHFRHNKTGAEHYHFASQSEENVFLVALRTIPTDSTGVAHILEHTALCGSEKYPVRDPFFMMLRRSLNTFMNAFTSSDWTAYPFASQNNKDYFNLLDVYLDAVFFSRLDPLDFAQEGHRVEFEDAADSDSDLVFKGVVFNEMKGAMSSPVSVLWQAASKYLYPSSTYHFNSGGEPEDIPDLTYPQLKQFYQTHYHPSNALFMTYGDIPAAELQNRFEENVLAKFEPLGKTISVANEKRYHAPLRVQEYYAVEDDTNAKTHHVLGWLLGDSIDLKQQLEAQLLSNVLLQDSAAPLRRALETTELGSAPSPLCGLEDSNKEMSFICGIEGSEPQHAVAFEKLVLETLEKVAENGVPKEQVEAVLHQLELSQREVQGDGFPYGLQLILSGLPTAVHRGDPIEILNLDPVLVDLRESIQDESYIKNLARRLLLDNQHRVQLSLLPDTNISARKAEAEKQRLADIKAGLDEAERTQIVNLAEALQARQNKQDDPGILPKVGVEDIPDTITIPTPDFTNKLAGRSLTWYSRGTNGLSYQHLIHRLPELDEQQLALLSHYSSLLPELGVGERDYLETQAWQTRITGGVSASAQVRGAVDDVQDVQGYFSLSSKSLLRNHAAMTDLLCETLHAVRFNETTRIKDLLSQKRAAAEQGITGNGHLLAVGAASSRMSSAANLAFRTSGLQGISSLQKLDDSLQNEDTSTQALESLCNTLQGIHAAVLTSPTQFLAIAEREAYESCVSQLADQWNDVEERLDDVQQRFRLEALRDSVRQLWTTNTQVNFCAKVYPTVPSGHKDAAALWVLGEFMKNGFLHRVIREKGGAYGAGAGQNSDVGAFRFLSYRDPRLEETLQDFDGAVAWMLEEQHKAAQLEEAILGIVSSIDKPGSPAGEARTAHYNTLFGRSPEQRQAQRASILEVTIDDLRAVTERYLLAGNSSVAVVTNTDNANRCLETAEWDVFNL